MIKAAIDQLTPTEQPLLMERLASRLRAQARCVPATSDSDLAAMANDPANQRELKETDVEFAAAEADGLNHS